MFNPVCQSIHCNDSITIVLTVSFLQKNAMTNGVHFEPKFISGDTLIGITFYFKLSRLVKTQPHQLT